MRFERPSRLIAMAALAWMTLAATDAQAQPGRSKAPQGETIRYTMARGDTLYGLANRFLLRRGDYRAVQRLNRIANPRRIPVGKVLTVPVSLLRTETLDARLIAARGNVQITSGGRDLPVTIGMPVAIGSTLATGDTGFLTIELPNGSRTTLPTRSRVTIRQLRRFLLGDTIDYDLEVGSGKVETEAMPVGGRGQFRIRTQRAVSAVRGTRFRVGFADEQTSAEVLEGVVAVGAGNAPGETVEQGFGARIARDGAITEEALLPPVELIEPGKVQIDPMVELQLAASPAASAYHVQIGKDAGFVDVVAEQVVQQPVTRFADLPNGNWFVRATAISQSGLEGLYQTYAMKRRLTGLAATAVGTLASMRFRWSGAGEGQRVYRFQMTGEDQTDLPVIDEGGLGPEGLELRNLEYGTYYWRVGVRQFLDGEMTEKWLPFEKLIVAPEEKPASRRGK
jgi:hypothetical protein